MGSSTEKTTWDLRQILEILRKRSRLIILVTLLTTLAVGLISTFVMKPVYQAKTLLMVTVASEKLEINQLLNQTGQPVLTMNTYLGQMKSEELMKRIIIRHNLPDLTIARLGQMIDASIVKDSNLIEVKVNNTDPAMARKIADALSYEYLELMKQFMFSSVVVISPANTPTSPIKPNIQLNIALALMAGLLLSILLSFLLEYLDNTVNTLEDIEHALQTPVLGLIPVESNHNRGVDYDFSQNQSAQV
jgi:capsular polysaccharide biosynthesis protein